jgi:hypothetical protein
VVGAGVSLKAVLRIGARVGLRTGVEMPVGNIDFGVGAGISFFADVAAFEARVESIDPALASEGADCVIEATNTYGFAVGGAVGASAYFQETTWGPVLESTTALVSEIYPPVCVEYVTSASASLVDGSLVARQTMNVPSTTTENPTAVVCKSPGLLNCPLSLQEIVTGTVTRVLTVSTTEDDQGSQGSSSTLSIDFSTRPFGSAARDLKATAGIPTPVKSATVVYSSSSSDSDVEAGSSKADGNSRNIIIGVSVGIGVPLFAGILGVLYW